MWASVEACCWAAGGMAAFLGRPRRLIAGAGASTAASVARGSGPAGSAVLGGWLGTLAGDALDLVFFGLALHAQNHAPFNRNFTGWSGE